MYNLLYAQIKNRIQKYTPAPADLTKALELNPDDAAAYNNRGIAYHNKGEHDLAIVFRHFPVRKEEVEITLRKQYNDDLNKIVGFDWGKSYGIMEM